jgi:hypothetical protein
MFSSIFPSKFAHFILLRKKWAIFFSRLYLSPGLITCEKKNDGWVESEKFSHAVLLLFLCLSFFCYLSFSLSSVLFCHSFCLCHLFHFFCLFVPLSFCDVSFCLFYCLSLALFLVLFVNFQLVFIFECVLQTS